MKRHTKFDDVRWGGYQNRIPYYPCKPKGDVVVNTTINDEQYEITFYKEECYEFYLHRPDPSGRKVFIHIILLELDLPLGHQKEFFKYFKHCHRQEFEKYQRCKRFDL